MARHSKAMTVGDLIALFLEWIEKKRSRQTFTTRKLYCTRFSNFEVSPGTRIADLPANKVQALSRRHRVDGTPFFIVNDNITLGGAQPPTADTIDCWPQRLERNSTAAVAFRDSIGCYELLADQDNLPNGFPFTHKLLGECGLLQRESTINEGFQGATFEEAE